MSRPFRRPAPDGAQQHRDWLSLIDVSGPFLSLPVLRTTWPTLDPLDRKVREQLRTEHALWADAPADGQRAWIEYVLGDLLQWGDTLRFDVPDTFTVPVAEHDTSLAPSFLTVEPGEEVEPRSVRLLGMICPSGQHPTARVPDSDWVATPADRLAHMCRYHNVELGLATNGRWWTLVWAPRDGVTTTAVFDATSWAEAAERDVVRAFVSVLCRRRFFGVKDSEKPAVLLRASLASQEDITEALGVQVRQAVELLVAATGRADVADREHGGPGLADIEAHDVYRGAVAVMMRVVFLLFAEERGLLPADNDLYASAYSAGGLCAELEQRANEGSEELLEHSHAAWHRLLALFNAVYHGIEHPRLTLHAHDGSLFDPNTYPWLPLSIDDRTVLHMLRSVQYVQIGTGKSKERRQLSFAALDVEQIGYVYEGLLSFEGFRAESVTVGLIGKEGLEAEVPLSQLEALAALHRDPVKLGEVLTEKYKESKIGTAGALAKALAPLNEVEREEARKKLLAVTRGEYELAGRLLPFYGIIRADLRCLPVVILPGALFVTESALRKNTGTHYTPRKLAQDVVKHALQPLVYEPGPLQTADTERWKLKSSGQILSLKIADIAMGSAAFLVAAARYLADHLIEAWKREGVIAQEHQPAQAVDPENDPLVIEARRQIIEHCLYGVDINPMAVEMAKLSLWLVSMDPQRPFTFLDDRLVAGDSLLGITSLEQLEYMHMDPKQGRELHEGTLLDWTSGVGSDVAEVAARRRMISSIGSADDPIAALAAKRNLLKATEDRTERLRFFADLVTGAALAGSRKGAGSKDPNARAEIDEAKARGRDGYYAEAARLADEVIKVGDERAARKQRNEWLAIDQVIGGFAREPLHWPLVFPEVFEAERGGFDAIVGNPPFVHGSRISSTSGTAYRELLVNEIAQHTRGNADIVAFFCLRIHALLNKTGQAGLIATNTLAQGDTREIGIDRILASGTEIRRAIKSKRWPSRSAKVEYCAIWTTQVAMSKDSVRLIDGEVVPGITATLDPASTISGNPHRLKANTGIAYYGTYVLSMGFTMEPSAAAELIARDPRNKEVLFPYLGGSDVTDSPSFTASRWIVSFRDWSRERAESYRECFAHVEAYVKPEREKNSSSQLREYFWRYKRPTLDLFAALSKVDRAIVITRHSKMVLPVFVPSDQVISDAAVAFVNDDPAMLGLLSSAAHYWWAASFGSTLKTDIRYAPTDIFETFPRPELTGELRALGNRLDIFRREVMQARQVGLTATYNLLHSPTCFDKDIVELREIHRAIDDATCEAYGWTDLPRGLAHGFQDLGREIRYTIETGARREILDRLLELNHQRHAAEIAAGDSGKKKPARPKADSASDQASLF
ncbi:Eco57I restriction-modification methylase domain-containing protein [Catellatospora sichuanensis]|uniref:Eco57I restriction-modification methylase domain-containing protein n=1 Tax=Catellatospora sichuanensis TaxID=1969805 RepID=UPI001182B9EE|nr:DNA methyltransferase [Catellatospora sichuanensis]